MALKRIKNDILAKKALLSLMDVLHSKVSLSKHFFSFKKKTPKDSSLTFHDAHIVRISVSFNFMYLFYILRAFLI